MFIRVRIYDLEDVEHAVELPATEPIARILPALTQRLRLPGLDDGKPVQYDLFHYKSGELIKPVSTLHMAGVVNGSALGLKATVDPFAVVTPGPFSAGPAGPKVEEEPVMRARTPITWRDYLPQIGAGIILLLALVGIGVSRAANVPQPIIIEVTRVLTNTEIVTEVAESVEIIREVQQPIVISQPVSQGPTFRGMTASPAGLCFVVDPAAQLMCHAAETNILYNDLVRGQIDETFEIVTVAGQFYFVNQQTRFYSEIWQSSGIAGSNIEVMTIPGLATTPPIFVNGSYIFAQPEQVAGWQSLHLYAPGSERAQRFANVFVAHDWYANSLLHNDILYFAGRTDDSGWELWRTDGSIAGTYMLQDLNKGALASSPRDLVIAGNDVYFTADAGEGRQIWLTDGSPAGTRRFSQAYSPNLGDPRQLTAVGEALYFVANDALTGSRMLYTTNDLGLEPLYQMSGRSFELAATSDYLILADIQTSGAVDIAQFNVGQDESIGLATFTADAYRPVFLTAARDQVYMIVGTERGLWRTAVGGYEVEAVAGAPFGLNELVASGDAIYFNFEERRGAEGLAVLFEGEINRVPIE